MFLIQFSSVLCSYPTFEKCKITDTECLKTSAQNSVLAFSEGVPEYGTDVLDTMDIKSIKVDLAGLKLNVADATLKGLKNGIFEKVKFNMKKNQLEMKMSFQNLELKGKYVASGRLLILPISGDGMLTIKLKHLILDSVLPFEIVKNAEGKDVIELKSYKFKFDARESVNFHLTNLFNGNKELSDAMHNFMNSNWKAVAEEFGRPIIDETFKIIFNSIKNFFNHQALEDVTIN